MKVMDIMTTNVVSIRQSEPLSVAARLMWECDCGAVPVVGVDDEQIVGMITDRDICMATWTKDRAPSAILVSEATSRDLYACRDDDTIAAAEELMRSKQVRRIPVLNRQRRLVGILSLADIAKAYGRALGEPNARELAPAEIAATLELICTPRANPQPQATM